MRVEGGVGGRGWGGWGWLEHGSPRLQTPNYNSLLILNKLLFSFFHGEIAGSPFGLRQHLEKIPIGTGAPEQTGRTPTIEPTELTACLADPRAWRFAVSWVQAYTILVFEVLQALSRICFKVSFFRVKTLFPTLFSEFSSVQLLSRVRLFATPWTTAHQASLPITNSQSLLNPCPLSRWCHPTIWSSVIPFFSCLQSFPASESFPMSQLFASGGQSIGASSSASVLPMNTQDWLPLGWTGWISLQSKGL